MSEEDLQIAEKRSERQRRERKIYPSECRAPRIARRDKKAFLSDQCKEIEENNKIEKIRDLFKKFGDIKETFHAWIGMIVDRNSKNLTETEENNRMGKTRDLFKKIGVTKGTFHAKMGTIKNRNVKYLTEAEEIKKRWQEYTENYTRKVLMTQLNPMVWSLT